MAQSFIFGGDTGLSYEALKKRRELAEAMLAASSGRAPQNVGEGLTAIGNAIGGRIALNRINKQEGTYRQQGIDDATAAYGGFGGFGAASGGTASQPTDMGASNIKPDADYIRQGMIKRGLPEHVADGFMANFQDESGLNPGINEANPTVPGSRGGFGFAQWTGPRRVALERFAQSRGKPASDPDTQLDFLMVEGQGSEKAAFSKILSSPDTASAAQSIVTDFLRPAPEHRIRRVNKYSTLGGPQAGLTADDVPKNMVAGMGDAGVGDALFAADAMEVGGGDNLIAIIQQATLPELQAMDPGAMSFEERNAATQRMRELADTMESQIGEQRREDFPNADFPAARDNARGPTLSGLTSRDPQTMTPGERNVITRQMQGMGDNLEEQLGYNRVPTPNPRRPVPEMPIPTPRPNFGRNHGVTSDDLAAAIQNRAAPGGGGIPIPTPRPNQGQYNGVTSDDLASAIQNRPALGSAGIPTPTPRPDPNIVERMGGQFEQPMNGGIPIPTPRPDPRQSNLTADDVPPGMLAGGDNAAIADALRATKGGRIGSPPADIQTGNLDARMGGTLPVAPQGGIDPNLMPIEAMQPDQGGNPRDAILQALIKSSGSQQLANADPNIGILAALMGNKGSPPPASAGAFPPRPQEPGQSSGQGESYFPPAPQAPGQGQQGVGGLDPRLINALSNPYLPAGHKAVLGAMLQQQLSAMQPQSPKEALELRKLQIEVDQASQPKQTDDIREYEFAKQNGYEGSYLDFQTAVKSAGASNTNVNVGQADDDYTKKLNQNLAEKYIAIQDGEQAARSKMATLQGLKSALSKADYTGMGGETLLSIKRGLKAIGVDVGDVGPEEMANALGNQMALMMRSPSNGAGMPGAMSDKDREFLVASVPGIGKTREGNLKLIDYMMRIEQRSIDVAKMAREYADKHGQVNNGFYQELGKWSEANPLFPEVSANEAPAVGETKNKVQWKVVD